MATIDKSQCKQFLAELAAFCQKWAKIKMEPNAVVRLCTIKAAPENACTINCELYVLEQEQGATDGEWCETCGSYLA